MLTLKKLSVEYNTQTILDEVTISFGQHESSALVGENGTGKSTLLKVCAGIELPDSGKVTVDVYDKPVLVDQEFPVETYRGMTGVEYISKIGSDFVARGVRRLLGDFLVDEKILLQKVEDLSGGQQKILALATALARRPKVLLVDEPENHLDLVARAVLIDLLKQYRGCLIFVSHDHELINAVATRIVELEDGSLTSYVTSYQEYLDQKQRRNEGEERMWKAHERKVDQLDKVIKRMRVWVQQNPDLGAQLRSRKTQLKKLHEKAPDKPKVIKKAKMSTSGGSHHKKRIITLDKASLAIGNATLFTDVSIEMFADDKVALLGRNGAGKTTFLKAIQGKIPMTGNVKMGESVNIGYFSQEAVETLNPEMTPLEALSEVYNNTEDKQRAMLARYLIGADLCIKKISSLSGGQKSRLRFCMLFAASYDLILLDEPSNYLDPVTWDILATALSEYKGAILLVSHDRMFIDQVAKTFWKIEDTKLEEYRGTISDYVLSQVV